MDLSWTQEQRELRKATLDFARKELNDDVRERDEKSEFSLENWNKCGQFGIHGLPIPQEYGGSGFDALTTICALEALGLGCKDNGLIFSINAHLWACEIPILTFGTQEQKSKYLPRLCSGELIGGNAMSEPDSGSDAFSLRTTAEKRGDKWVLNGAKTFVSNAPLADLIIVYATVDPGKGSQGITAFLVEKSLPGVSFGRKTKKMGTRTSPMAELFLDDCEVSGENVLGKVGAGVAIFSHSMEWERSCILASAVGSMERQLDSCIKYARQRKQFGKPIGKFQLVASKIVDMRIRLETARSMLYKVGWLKNSGGFAILEASMAKLHISECWVQSSLDAIQVYGGYGYMAEFEVERELRDAIGSKLYSGTSEIQRLIIAELMGL